MSIRADPHPSNRHIRLSFSQFVHVENHLLRLRLIIRTPEADSPTVNRILASFDSSRVVVPAMVAIGNRLVGLLDMRKHLRIELRLQLLGGFITEVVYSFSAVRYEISSGEDLSRIQR